MASQRTKAILTIVLFISLFLIKTDYTDADLVDEETVINNRFTATTLAFSQRHTANNIRLGSLFNVSGFQPEGFDLEAVRIKKDGETDFKYRIKTIKKSGDDNFCNSLNLEVLQNWQIKYQENLLNLVLDNTIPSNGRDDWVFYIGLDNDDPSLKNKTCEFDLDFKTWRNNPEEESGFWDQRLLNNIIISGNW